MNKFTTTTAPVTGIPIPEARENHSSFSEYICYTWRQQGIPFNSSRLVDDTEATLLAVRWLAAQQMIGSDEGVRLMSINIGSICGFSGYLTELARTDTNDRYVHRRLCKQTDFTLFQVLSAMDAKARCLDEWRRLAEREYKALVAEGTIDLR